MTTRDRTHRSVGAFIFDLDGTLVDSRRDIAMATNVARAELGLPPLPEPVLRGYVGDGVRLLLRRALGHDQAGGDLLADDDPRLEPALAAYLDHYARHLLDHTRAYDGVAELLARLPAVPLAVATNKPGGFSRAILDGLGLGHHFRIVVGGDETSARKPDPAHLRACLRGLAVAPRDVVMVGDSGNDIRAARALGGVAVGCAWGLVPADRLRALEPDHLLEHPLDLATLYPRPAQATERETP